MELKKYVSDAIRTESRIPKVTTNVEVFTHALNAFIAAGTILDMFKKNAFYGKAIDSQEYTKLVIQLGNGANRLPIGSIEDSNMVNDPSWVTTDLDIDPRVFHSIIGAMTESAELGEALRKAMNDSTLDLVNVLEEFGDINWYQAIAVDALNGDFAQILERNIAKLKARFPAKFTNENAVNRDLVAERAILEGKTE